MLGRIYDAIEYRGFDQSVAQELAKWAGVPVYNGLTDEWHPTQILAEFLTFEESVPKPLDDVFDEAENRMHTIKAVLVATLGS